MCAFGFFPLLFLSLHPICYFDPRKGGVKATAGKRGSETLRRLPTCRLWREEEAWKKGEGKGETQEQLCDQAPAHLGGWKFWPEA